MDEIKNPSQDRTQAEYALRKYLELFTSACDLFKFFVAQNGALEFFGRTVKGNQKIHDYLRYEVCSQYDHLCFATAQACEPFESKPTHMATRQFPTEHGTSSNQTSDDSPIGCEKSICYKTTPTHFNTESNIKDRRGSITPPSTAKRFKHDEGHDLNRNFSPLLNTDDYFERKDTNMKTMAYINNFNAESAFLTPINTVISSHCGSTSSSSSISDYSELQYFETTGILRSSTQPEHRNFLKSSSLNANGTWDRETKIQVSYRLRLHDNDIQFALIIYQNVHQYSLLSKRNLMSEFEEVATNESLTLKEDTTIRSPFTPPQAKRKLGRRLRLF